MRKVPALTQTDLVAIAHACGGAARQGAGWRALCPAHNDRTPSLSLSLSPTGVLLVRCWSGCDARAVLRAIAQITNMSSASCARDILTPTNSTRAPGRSEKNAHDAALPAAPPEWVTRLWDSALPLRDDHLPVRYLARRGVDLRGVYPASLRFSPACKITQSEYEFLPALLARFSTPTDTLSTVHRIYLQEPGVKAAVANPKRICSSPAIGGAIRLGEPGETLGIAEGAETALACAIGAEIPVWACYSAGMMQHVLIPPSVAEVVIFADNDRAGIDAAHKLAARLLDENRAIKLLVPPRQGQDWLDVLNA